jgi:hypothetical protein
MANLQETIMQFLQQNGKPNPQILGPKETPFRGTADMVLLRQQLNDAIAQGDYEKAQKLQDFIQSQQQGLQSQIPQQ